ncbi:hypothetical protein RJ641_033037 [Dillenia turbinata]|uniref:Uncharacterized protein n=1 Tax=Dillenia turbinata TaxID=194707 RepID=A0AAN8VUH6_9MAGN
MAQSRRKKPNILVTGAPGRARQRSLLPWRWPLSSATSTLANLSGRRTFTMDGTKSSVATCVTSLRNMMEEGGVIVNYHGCDFFPERRFNRVVVLQTDNTLLYDQITRAKLSDNIESKIFQTLLEAAKSSYIEDMEVAIKSETVEDIYQECGRTRRLGLSSWHPTCRV